MLERLEQRLSRLVEGTFGRLSRGNVQPVELARKLVKEMDDHQQVSVNHVYAPNVYDVYLSLEDHSHLTEIGAALEAELAEYVVLHARRNGYTVLTRPRVSLHVDSDLGRGAFGISCRMDENARSAVAAAQAANPAQKAQRTQVMQVQQPAPTWGLRTPAGLVPLTGPAVTIGRGKTNTVVLADTSVSREHAEVIQRAGTWFVRDRGSTNGIKVNGSTTTEAQVSPGDVILIGGTEMRIESGGA